MRIGVFGGTFDPIHYAHLIIGEHLAGLLDLDKMLFVPACQPPHKPNRSLSPPSHRLQMIRLAITDNDHFEACDVEISRGGVSYSIDTVRELRQRYGLAAEDLCLIMGSDSLQQLHTWRDPDKIIHECRVVVVNRPGYALPRTGNMYKGKVTVVDTPLIEISASMVRNRIKNGQSVRYLTPLTVIQFIERKGLYTK